MITLLKDIISFFIYISICPFLKNKKSVLVYHAIDAIERDDDPDKINVKPELFERHLAYLAKHPGRYIVTFDDGYGSVYSNALPLILKYKIKAINFISTDYVDGKADLATFFKYKHSPKAITWKEVADMKSCGVEIGSHSCSHRAMSSLCYDELKKEASASKLRIEDMTGSPVSYFSYPFGTARSFSRQTEEVLRACGFERAYLNTMGMDDSDNEPFRINRIRIYNSDNLFRFRMKVAGAYNWVDFVAGFLEKRKGAIGPGGYK